jgi:hypothetical protein
VNPQAGSGGAGFSGSHAPLLGDILAQRCAAGREELCDHAPVGSTEILIQTNAWRDIGIMARIGLTHLHAENCRKTPRARIKVF